MSQVARLVLAGATAAERLRNADGLTVFAVFSKSLYLRTENGALVCLGQASLAPGPLMALCEPWFHPRELPAPCHTTIRRRGGCLEIGACALALDAADIWTPPAFPELSFPALRAALAALTPLLPGRMPEEGLALLLPRLLEGGGAADDDVATRNNSSLKNVRELLRAEAWRGFISLRRWLVSGGATGERHLEGGVRSLLGLGPGLTPSGDDALAGMLLALSALRLAKRRDRLGGVIAEMAPRATNAISRAHLEAAALGQGAMPAHEAVSELMTGGAGLERIPGRLDRIGHSSGWDTFTGIVLTLTARLAAGE